MVRLWNAHLQQLQIPSALSEQAFADLAQLYGGNGRFYHNLNHIQFVLTKIEEIGNAQDLDTLRLAVWFHDVIYDPTTHDNEAQSAQYAARVLRGMGVSEGRVTAVSALIHATTHQEPVTDQDTKILLDADLAILATNTPQFDAYCQNIRKEYAHVPTPIYKSARKALLQSFIKRTAIYQTVYMQENSESKARENLEREIGRMGKWRLEIRD